MDPLYDRVGKAINIYETDIKDSISSLNRMRALSAGWMMGTGALVTAGVIFSNVAPLVAAVGLSGTVPSIKGKEVVGALVKYYKDKTLLKNSVSKLRVKYVTCDPNDNDALNEIKNDILDYYTHIGKGKSH